jgi:hypothetical protein
VGCGSSALAHLLAVTSDKFVREIYGLELAFSADGALPYLSTLPTIDGLDAIFFALDSAGARLGVVDGHASPSAGTSLIRSDGRVRLDEVHSAYKAGKTLLLTHLQNSHLGTARIARSIECDLHAAGLLLRKEVGANLFLTPPNSRGFDPHYDGHDVLILQLGGTKVWKAFEQLSEIPAGMEGGRLQPDQLSEQCKTFELTPGNVLYLPRGRPHVAYTNSENSLHLTLSIIPLTITDCLIKELSSNTGTYQPLGGGPKSAEIRIASGRMAALKTGFLLQWLENLNSLPECAPWLLPTENLFEAVRLANGVVVETEEQGVGETFRIHMPGASVTLGAHALEAIRPLLNGNTITASDLSLGGRSTESKIRFLNQLIDVGLVAPVGGQSG